MVACARYGKHIADGQWQCIDCATERTAFAARLGRRPSTADASASRSAGDGWRSRFCPHCGFRLPAPSRYCPECGGGLVAG